MDACRPEVTSRRSGISSGGTAISSRIYCVTTVEFARTIREARLAAGLTQAELAERAGTSQAAISAYERGAKTPSAATLERLLAASGRRLTSASRSTPVRRPTRGELETASRHLLEVLGLAAMLPKRHAAEPEFPGIPPRSRG